MVKRAFVEFRLVMAALRIFARPEGVAISPKHATLSTSGSSRASSVWRRRGAAGLAISLNASNDEQRNTLMH